MDVAFACVLIGGVVYWWGRLTGYADGFDDAARLFRAMEEAEKETIR